MSIIFDRPNGELCVLSIVNFYIFDGAIFRYMSGLLTVHFFDTLSDVTQSVTDILFFRASRRELSPYFSVTTSECFGRCVTWNCSLFLEFVVVSCSDMVLGDNYLDILWCDLSEFSWYCTLHLTDKYIHIYRPLTVISVFIMLGCPERLNYHEILSHCSWQIFSVLYLVPHN